MQHVTNIKASILAVLGVAGSIIANLLGGWDMALQTLVLFMGIDYITGLVVAGVFNKSKKTETGKLESLAGWKGLCKKGGTLLIVLVAAQLDKVSGTQVIRNAAIIAYIVNETLSITENAGLMGIPIPSIIQKALSVLNQRAENEEVQK
jgi:toxin secretion/phage lysis holin